MAVSAAPLKPDFASSATNDQQRLINDTIRIEGYTQFLCALFADDVISEKALAGLSDLRAKRSVTDKEHADCLKVLGKTVEDIDDMVNAGKRLAESLAKVS